VDAKAEQARRDTQRVAAGSPAPLGAAPTPAGVNFALHAPAATAVWLVVWPGGRGGARRDLPLDAAAHRSGEVWHVELVGVLPPLEWAWRVDRPPAPAGPSPDPQRLLLDPYARAVAGAERWGEPAAERRCLLAAASTATVREPPRYAATDRVVYELCVRGFTAHASSGVAAPGTFRGLLDKVPYLAELGVTTVELLPVAEWDELEVRQRDPSTGERLRNLWGYSPIAFSAPKAGLAAEARPGAAVAELRALVEVLHARGIEVVLDVVFNHTAERDGLPGDPVFSFGGIDPAGYYLVEDARHCYRDVTGCGNSVAGNRPAVVDLIVDALRWWVVEVGVDGFRFDLATVLLRGDDGEPLADPPLLRRIEDEPLLADRVLIAEPWDAGSGHFLGGFARRSTPAGARWSEWNDRFRDDVRRFVRGEPGMTGALAERLAGSRDLFGGGPLGPGHSINYVACHDGFTLADLVSYDRKRNERNGEGNRDGSDWNASWSGGVEGPTADPAVLALRRRQVRNFLTLLFVAQGVPMLLAGDERGRTQQGNNNAWCQDNEIGWLDWGRDDEGLRRFTRELIAFRRAHPALRRRTYFDGEGSAASPRRDVSWHGTRLGAPDWGPAARALAMHLAGEHAPAPDDDLYLAANAAAEELAFELPPPPRGKRWLRVAATWEATPRDLLAPGEEEPMVGSALTVPAFACALLRSG
jgi:glycogen operon protein